MKLAELEQKRLLKVFQAGADTCLRQLDKLSEAAWGTEALFLGDASQRQLEAMFAGSLEDCYGNWFWTEAAAFLVLFSRKPGMVVTSRFTRAHSGPVDALANRDAKAVAEVSNILINSFVGALADALERDLIVSAPESMTDSRRELLLRGLHKFPGADKLALSCLARFLSPGLVAEFSVVCLLDEGSVEKLRLKA